MALRYNPPANWPAPPAGWTPPAGWQPDPSWGPAPEGWSLWVEDDAPVSVASSNRSWFARHKVISGVGAAALLIGIASAASGGGDDASATQADSGPVAEADGAPADAADGDATVTDADEQAAAEKAAAEEAAAEKAAEEKAAKEKATKEKAPGIGDAVRDGKFQFTVTDVEAGKKKVGNEYLNTKAQGQFYLVDITVKNIGDEAQIFFADNQTLFNADGQEYSADSTASIYLDESNSFMEEINPGNTVKGTVVFDIPKGMDPSKIELHDSMLSGGVTVDLG
jgi:hypothetical protein